MYQNIEFELAVVNENDKALHEMYVIQDIDKVDNVNKRFFAYDVAKSLWENNVYGEENVIQRVKSAVFVDKKGNAARLCKDVDRTTIKLAYRKVVAECDC